VELTGGRKTVEIPLPTEEEVLESRYGRHIGDEQIVVPRRDPNTGVDRIKVRDLSRFFHDRIDEAAQHSGRREFVKTVSYYKSFLKGLGDSVPPAVLKVMGDIEREATLAYNDQTFQAAVQKSRDLFRESAFVEEE
jgi:hypothetical protein